MTLKDRAAMLLVALIWGTNFLAIRWGVDDMPPLLFLALRFFLVAIPAVWFVPRPTASWRQLAAVGGLVSLGQFSLLYVAIALGMPVGIAALVLQAQVLFTIVIAALTLGERPTMRQSVGVLLGTVGLAVVALGRDGTTTVLSVVLCLGAALSWASGNVVTRSLKIPGGLGLAVWSSALLPVPLLALSWLVECPEAMAAGVMAFGLKELAATLFTVIFSTHVGYGIFYSMLAKHQAASVVPFILLVPPIAAVAGWWAFGDQPSALELLGGLVMLWGLAIATVQWPSRSATRVA